jgi:hypothetical protein
MYIIAFDFTSLNPQKVYVKSTTMKVRAASELVSALVYEMQANKTKWKTQLHAQPQA